VVLLSVGLGLEAWMIFGFARKAVMTQVWTSADDKAGQ